MKTILAIFLTIFLATEIQSQVVKGKIVDENGDGLSSIDLQLYINPYIYNTTSSSDGSFIFDIITGVEEGKIPSGYAVSNNFPNPFNPTTRIGITLPVRENVKIEVFNLLGQEVIRPIEQTLDAGTNFIDIELNGMANGVYSARVTIGDKHIFVKKMMLVYGGRHLAISSGISNTEILKLNNTVLDMNIDSLVATSLIVGRKAFTDLPNVTADTLDLGNLTVERYCPGTPTVEYASKLYHTVQIGGQCWLKENLDVGIMIIDSDTAKDNGTIEEYCYNNDTSNCDTYGGLYQWNEAMQYTTIPGVRGICPAGWHIPMYLEYQTLNSTVGGDGNTLKAIGQGDSTEWGDGKGTNTSGFSALIAGLREYFGNFWALSNLTWFWSTTEYDSKYVFSMHLFYNSSFVSLDTISNKENGLSVRCIKD